MAMDGLIVFACALLTSAPPAPASADRAGKHQEVLDTTLAVQNAMRMAGDYLQRGDAKSAVLVLESQLARINGNRKYLELMATAYRKYVKELAQGKQATEARKYLERLCILEPDAIKDHTLVVAREPASSTIQKVKPSLAVKTAVMARAKGEDTKVGADPFDKAFESNRSTKDTGEGTLAAAPETKRPFIEPSAGREAAALRLLERAATEFKKERYAEARALFEEAFQADPNALNAIRLTTSAGPPENRRSQWAYCKMHGVVEALNHGASGPVDFAGLEKEVRTALTMSPRLEKTGKWLLGELEERRNGAGGKTEKAAELDVRVQHQDERNAQGWRVAETASFRIFHNQPRDVVDKVGRVAEQTRLTMQKKWFGEAEADWNPKCSLYLHADGKEYQHFTGVPATSPGHSRMETDNGRVLSRRLDVRCDNPSMLTSVLPHETTHVVLAGRFGKHQVPRWADEGIAVLTEPAAKVEMHRKNLARSRDEQQLFAVRDLMSLDDYPQPRRVGAFYAQSVSLVEFLAKEGGPVTFARFVRDGLENGYETALRKHYRYRSFDELQESWTRHAFGSAGSAVTASKNARD